MRRPKRQILKVTEVFRDAIGPRGIRVVVPKDRIHLECGHYIDERKQIFHGTTRRCAVCQTRKASELEDLAGKLSAVGDSARVAAGALKAIGDATPSLRRRPA